MRGLLPKREGFTLIELLIVIVILGILAMIATSLFWNVKDRGLQASMQQDLRTAATQQELYHSVHSTYAPDVADLVGFDPSTGVQLTITYAAANGWAAVVNHVSLTAQCGLAMHAAPISNAPPATEAGVVACSGL